MSNPAVVDDLAARWRPLSDQEETNGQTFLDDAWRMLRRKVSDLEASVEADADIQGEAIRVLCAAVLRVMKNPDGFRQEGIDDHTWSRDESVSAGVLYFTDDELDALSDDPVSRGGAFSYNPLAGYPESRFDES